MIIVKLGFTLILKINDYLTLFTDYTSFLLFVIFPVE